MCFPFLKTELPIFQDFSNFFKCVNTIFAQGPVRGPINMLVKALCYGRGEGVQRALMLEGGWDLAAPSLEPRT